MELLEFGVKILLLVNVADVADFSLVTTKNTRNLRC